MSSKRHFITFFMGAAAFLTPLEAAVRMGNDPCSQEFLMAYYPENFVADTLEKYDVPQAQRMAIIRELAEKDREVVPTVEEKAGKMNPNPLRDPQHRQEAVKIFRETLYTLFADVMRAHGIDDREQIQAMLDDIQQQKAKQFAACMEEQRPGTHENTNGLSKRQNFSRQQRGPNTDYNNTQPEDYYQEYDGNRGYNPGEY